MALKKILAAGVSTVCVISGCGGGGDNSSEGGSASYTNQHLPQAISIDIPSTLLASNTASTRTLRELDVDPVSVSTPFYPGEGDSLAYYQLRSQVSELKSRLDERELDFMAIDSIWDQIQEYCSGYAEGVACEIPEGQMNFTMSQSIHSAVLGSVQEVASELGFVLTEEDIANVALDLPPIGSTLPMGQTVFINNPAGIYDYSVQTVGVVGEYDSYAEDISSYNFTLKWTTAKDKLEYTEVGSESFEDWSSSYTSTLTYSAEADGDSILLRDTYTSNSFGTRWNDVTQLSLKELNNAKNGVIISADFTNNGNGYGSTYHVDGQADDEGGYVKSRNTFNYDSEDDVWHFKESFDANGQLTAAEECKELSAGYCDIDANWAPVSGYNDISIDDPYYIDEDIIGEFEDEFKVPEVTVSGLPDDVLDFVVAKQTAVPPFDNADDILCYGVNYGSYSEAYCTVIESELPADGIVYSQNFDINDPEQGYVLNYTAIPEATYKITEASSFAADGHNIDEAPIPAAFPAHTVAF